MQRAHPQSVQSVPYFSIDCDQDQYGFHTLDPDLPASNSTVSFFICLGGDLQCFFQDYHQTIEVFMQIFKKLTCKQTACNT